MDSPNLRLGRFVLPSLVTLACTAVLGQERNPFYVGAGQAFTQESNLFRAATEGNAAPKVSDWHSMTSLLAGVDQPIGRQRLFGDAAVRHARYNDNIQLSHTGGNVVLGLDWSAADVLSGRLSASADRSLARYAPDLGPGGFTALNMQNTQEFLFRGQYGFESLLAVEAGFVRRRLDFSAPGPEFAANEFEQDAVSLGLKYRPTGPLSIGIAVRRTEGQYHSALNNAGPDDFERDDVDLTALWIATGQSTLTARLSRTKETHQLVTSRNLSTTTGALGWTYKPTGKLELGIDLIRDTGAEAAFGAAGAPAADASLLSTTVQLRAQYEVTAKIQVLASVRQQRRELVAAQGNSGSDETLEPKLGVNWSPLRSVLVGCSFGREKRDSTPTQSYSASYTRCLAQLKTQ